MTDAPQNNKHLTIFHFIAITSLTLAVLSLVSPQVESLGRGLRTTLPTLAISFVAILIVSPGAFFRSISRYRVVLLFGLLFLVQAALRFILEEYKANVSWHTFFNSPLLALTMLVWIGALTELGERTVRRFRSLLLFSWCTCLALGVPILITHLGVARLTMGNVLAEQNSAIWAPYGVGAYHVYTSMAVCVAPLYVVTIQHMKGIQRWIALLLICLSVTAVISSTFAMASILVSISTAGVLLISIKNARGFSRWRRSLLVLALISMGPLLYIQAKQFPQTEFLISKLENIQKGVMKSGLEKGDSTSRGRLFLTDMRGFLTSPILGYIPTVTGKRDSGHSSLANSLTLFGLFGTALWGVVMYKLYQDARIHACSTSELYGVRIAWIVLVVGGIMNPTWHSSATLSILLALTITSRKKAVQINGFPSGGA